MLGQAIDRITTRRLLAGAIVVAVAFTLALAYGTGYGSRNQLTYLVEPLHRANPALYARDWLVGTTTMYHPVFAWLVTPLYALDPRGARAFGLAQLAVMTATWLVIDRMLGALVPRGRLPMFLLLAGLLALGGGRAIAGSYLFAGYLQPSSLASLGWLVALLAWLRDRPLVAGVVLALGGALHVNFLVLGIGWMTAVELSTWRLGSSRPSGPSRLNRLRRLAAVVGPSLVVLAGFAPTLIGHAGGEHAAESLRILVKFSAPGHYDPARVSRWLVPLIAWLVVAWAVLPAVREAAGAVADRLWRLAAVGTAIVVGAIVVARLPGCLGVTRLFAPRIAPFAQLASQLLVIAAALAPAGAALARGRALVVIGAAVLIAAAVRLDGGHYQYAGALALVAGAGIARSLGRRRIAIAIAVATCVIALAAEREALLDPPVFWPECGGTGCALAHWAETSTPVDAVFLTPPGLGWFRLIARRAIVVDTKSPPLYPDELVGWYGRLCAVVGVADAPTHEWVEARWATLTAVQLTAAAQRFGADYVVLDKHESASRLAKSVAPMVYEDSDRIVYRVR